MERLSPQDLITLWPDEVGHQQDMGVLAVMDARALPAGVGVGRLDEVRDHVAGRLHLAPRLRQVVHTPPPGLGRPLWVDAPRFDIADHVRAHPLPAGSDDAVLPATVLTLGRRPLDHSRPLWEMWLLPGLLDERVGLFLRVHHVLADGPAALTLLGAFLDLAPDRRVAPAPPWTPAPLPTAGELLEDNLQRCGSALTRAARLAGHPDEALRRAHAGAAGLRSAGIVTRAPRSSLNRPIGHDRRLAVVRTDLDPVTDTAHRLRVSVNDVLLAAVAGGLHDLLRSRGERTTDLVLQAVVPIALPRRREDPREGNVLGQMTVPMPVGGADPVERLHAIAAETRRRKQAAIPRRPPVLRGRALQRAAMRLLEHQRSYNVYVANIRGPDTPLYLVGAELLDVLPVVPLMGNLTFGVGALSYAGRLAVVTVADAVTCPDVDVFATGLDDTLRSLTAVPTTSP